MGAALSSATARGGNIYVTANVAGGTIGEYNATTGAVVNAALVSGLNVPTGIAVFGSDLFVANQNSGTIGEYTTDGATVNASLVSGLNRPNGIAVSGSDLFVTANYNGGTIGEYNATTGAVVNAALVSGLNYPADISVSGPVLFVANTGTIGEYTIDGATVNASLVSGLDYPSIAVSGSNLFVANFDGWIGEYNATTGAVVNASLVSGLSNVYGIAVAEDVPEPGSLALLFSFLGIGALGLLVYAWRRRWSAAPGRPAID